MGSSKSTFEKPSQQENGGFHIFELHLPSATYAGFFVLLLIALLLMSLYILIKKWPLFGKTRQNSRRNPTTTNPSAHHKPSMVPFEMSVQGRHAPSGRVMIKPNGNGSYAFSSVPTFDQDRFLPAPPRVSENEGAAVYSIPSTSKPTGKKQPLHSSIMSLLDTTPSATTAEGSANPSHQG